MGCRRTTKAIGVMIEKSSDAMFMLHDFMRS